ncbi:M56 family metallopeptidase [Pelotomaculum terephthalicicum JT]|uniref:M56 family metallopeptidase n=1 Tax=Pelotomaculum terephthalicicum TaxID=206393 RepID=UPI001F03E7CE|nr:M56 family metallopeptidase [Pelotomaculum terephthalicicum]MCG9968686.1 M56 family metallopeptidase [Pelotomaculum terephthalicicum JT]
MNAVFLQVLNMSLTASYVILFVLAARLLLKKAPKIFSYALWGVVLFRLTCPFSFESLFSLFAINPNPIPSDIIYAEVPQINTGIALVDHAANPILSTQTAMQGASVNPMQIWAFTGSMIWLAGIAVLLIYSLVSLLRLRSKLVGAVKGRDNIYLADYITSPFVMGVIRPKIYLPSTLSEREQDYIILHEQTHISRLDHIVKIVAFLVLIVHWFNPLVWLAFMLSVKDMETSCDESVMKHMDTDIRKEYSASLLSLATGRKIVAGIPLAFGEGDTKSRIKNVLNYKKPAFWIVAAAVVVCLVLTVCLIANPRTDSISNSYEHLGYTVLPPDDYNGKVALTEQNKLDDNTIIEVYQTATREKYPEAGFMFRIVRHTPAEFEDYFPLVDMIGGVEHFAKDDNYYYSCERPTDVQADTETKGVYEEYSALCKHIDSILSSFIEVNHLTAYDHNAAVYKPEYTYPGNHAIYAFTLSNGAKFKLILSQPVRQGAGGIWCVERMYDENNNLYLAMPDTDLTAMEYYKEQQNEADAGHKVGSLEAEDVALTYLDKVWSWADDIAERSIRDLL